MNNFYNEPPFAERLKKIQSKALFRRRYKKIMSVSIVGCRIGNDWGVSWEATPHYDQMSSSFLAKGNSIMVGTPREKSLVGRRIQGNSDCRKQFIEAVRLIDRASVPSASQADYEAITRTTSNQP
jgi:hypothetical protein